MTRTRFAVALAGASLAAGAAGCALGWFLAPTSDPTTRKRAWKLMVERARERAIEEIEKKRRMSCVS